MKNGLIISVMLLLATPVGACIVSYTGSLSVGHGLVGTATWDDPSSKISYTVSQATVGGPWTYSYTFSVEAKDISHFIIETSPSFTEDNLLSINWSVCHGTYSIEDNKDNNGNPYMPTDLYGIKFTPGDVLDATVTFTSDREPVWGDFYARDGKTGGTYNTVYNTGFTATDTDPAIPPANNPNGVLTNHILVPDTVSAPEPMALALVMAGGVVMLRRRK